MLPRIRKVLFLLAVWSVHLCATATGAPPAPAWPHQTSDLPPSPRVTWGQLENGLRYAILPNRTPPQRVSLRLLVLAGSLHERDDERGYAHFVEHMAFNGTRHYAPGQLVKSLQSAGISFGPHANAFTTYTSTLYKLDLPENSESRVQECLRILRDFADGMQFAPEEVKRERGVILNEALSRANAEKKWTDALNAFLYRGTLFPARAPIGDDKIVRRATHERLRAFYEAWYRPERMVVVVSGDVHAATIESWVRESFHDLVGRGGPRPEPTTGQLSGADGDIHLHVSRRAGVEFGLYSISPIPTPKDNAEYRRWEIQVNLALVILRERLRRIQLVPGGPINNFEVQRDRVFNRYTRLYVSTVGSADRWEQVLAAGENELRRALQHGFDHTELEAAKRTLRSAIKAAALETDTFPSHELADGLSVAIESGRVFNFPNEDAEAKLAIVEQLTPEDCIRALREAWNGVAGRLFVGVHPDHRSRLKNIRAVRQRLRQKEVTAPSAIQPVVFGYDSFGPEGTVIAKRHADDVDVWLVEFANGVRLNVKTTAFEKGSFRFRIRFGGGRAAEPREAPGLALWAGAGWIYGGLGRHSIDEILRALNGTVGGFSASTTDDANILHGNAPVHHADAFLKMAAAFFVDPAFAAPAKEKVRPYLNSLYTDLGRTAAGPTQRAILPFLAGQDTRFGLPDYETVTGQSMDTLRQWMRPALAQDPIEIGIVGDISVEQAIELVAQTFGAFPVRRARQPLVRGREPPLPIPPAERSYRYPTDAEPISTVALYWPARDVKDIATRRELMLLAEILEDRLRVKIREDLGATYTPKAEFSVSDVYPDFGHIKCELRVQPRSARRLLEATSDLAQQISLRGVTAEELERARAQLIAQGQRAWLSNEYWLEEVVSDAQERPFRLAAAKHLIEDFTRPTRDQLNRHAAKYLTRTNLFRFLIEPD